MKVYKGTDKEMKCRGYQYEQGKTAETDAAKLCNKGFHACEAPLDVFAYYSPATSRYFEADLEDVSDERHSDDTKVVGRKITLGAELNVAGLCKAHFEYVKAHTTTEHTDPKMATAGDSGAATAGDRGAATAGYRGAATAGYRGAATAGSYGAATAGDRGAATAGYSGAATAGSYGAATAGDSGAATAGSYGAAPAGDRGAATAGYSGAATAGDSGAATAGYRGAATSRGSVSVGENGCGLARGNGVKVKGGLGAVLVICEENVDDFNIKEWHAFIVDGADIKADTWYHLVNGELEEVNG